MFESECENLNPGSQIPNKDSSLYSPEDSFFFERNSNKCRNFILNSKDFLDYNLIESGEENCQEKCAGKNYSKATTTENQINRKEVISFNNYSAIRFPYFCSHKNSAFRNFTELDSLIRIWVYFACLEMKSKVLNFL